MELNTIMAAAFFVAASGIEAADNNRAETPAVVVAMAVGALSLAAVERAVVEKGLAGWAGQRVLAAPLAAPRSKVAPVAYSNRVAPEPSGEAPEPSGEAPELAEAKVRVAAAADCSSFGRAGTGPALFAGIAGNKSAAGRT